MSAKNGSHWNPPAKALLPTPPPAPPKSGQNSLMMLSQTIAEINLSVLRQRIEAAKQRLESLNGKHVGQAEIYAVIEILEGKR